MLVGWISSEFSQLIHFRYGSCATPRDFEIYAPDATFEDPLMSAKGYALVYLVYIADKNMSS